MLLFARRRGRKARPAIAPLGALLAFHVARDDDLGHVLADPPRQRQDGETDTARVAGAVATQLA
jgi:hypothetical protein